MQSKFKVFTLSIFATIALSQTVFANAEKISTTKTYDKGWWWYEEKYQDPETKKEEIIKYKLSPAEKAKIDKEDKTNKLLKMIVIEQKENKKLNKKILKRLNYAFPNTTPEYTINKKTGKKCKSNSSSDCFILPVIAEGQHVPVLKSFLRNPSPKNSKEWLKWQATYFNHINKISNGLRFAFLKDGSDAYNTSTDYSYGDSLFFTKAEAAKGAREAQIIDKMKDRLAYLIFVGQNEVFEKLTKTYENFRNFDSTFLKNQNIALIFPTEESKNKILHFVNKEMKSQGYTEVPNFFKHVKIAVRPDLYKNYNIRVTPSVVVFYQDKEKKKKLHQTLLTGIISVSKLRSQTMNFLKYNDIISAGEMGADKNWNSPETPILKKLKIIPKPKESFDFEKEDERLKKLEKGDKNGK
jgi:hypothetical protein